MTLSKYIKELQKLEAAGHGKCVVVYATDEEGNDFNKVGCEPTVGAFERERFGFIPVENFEDWEHEGGPNAICLN